jgi:hypothetical protein
MSLYQQRDVSLLADNWESIMDNVEKQKYLMIEPKLEEIQDVHKIILTFVKTAKRKIYGGFALNLLVKSKEPKDAFYKPDKVPDIDFYSPEPIVDLMKICNILHEKGYKYVVGREALHQETYSISVNCLTYCDISYTPRNIYNKMPFKEVDGYTLIHPHFMTIDYLRMLTDPLISYWRIGNDLKSFKRFFLLQKHFPLPYNNYPIDISGSTPSLDSALNTIFKFLLDKRSIIIVGFYAYNYFLNSSGIIGNKKNDKFKLLQIPYYELISTNYREDCLLLLELLNKNITINRNELKHAEFYPFFQFTGHSVEIYLGEDLIARIYNSNKKCIPYQDVPALEFKNNAESIAIKKSNIRLAVFPFALLYTLIDIMRARTYGDEDTKNLYYTMASHLIEMRNNYFVTNKKTYLDDTIFREFVVHCVGETFHPDKQRKLLIESRKKQNKRYTFMYEPSDGVKEPIYTYVFANSSGNVINNPKNLRLAPEMKDDNFEDDVEEDVFTNVNPEESIK